MQQAIDLIKRHEGCRLQAYRDTLGIWTIGWGFAHDVHQGDIWTQVQADEALQQQVDACVRDLQPLPWFAGLDAQRQAVIVDMRYQLGLAGLLQFRGFISALAAQDWPAAAAAGLDSRWARQCPNRAQENMGIISGAA